jgi:hypothetical protein
MGWQDIIIAGGMGLGSGTLGALVTPWAKWSWADKPQTRVPARIIAALHRLLLVPDLFV